LGGEKKIRENFDFNETNFIQIGKGLALISIVSAHTSVVNNKRYYLMEYILNSIGVIGVGIFFIFSGYLFYSTNKTFGVFLKKKIKTILIPWFSLGTLVFFYVTIRKGGITLYNWLDTLFVHSHLYYLSVLVLFYIIFFKIRNNQFILIMLCILSVISITLTGIIEIPIYPYINPFNWTIYFILGLWMKKYNLLKYLAWKCCKWLPLSGFLYALILTIYLVNGVYITYWKYAPLLSEAIAIAMVFGLAAWCSKRQKKGWLLYFGKLSFPVYLLHTPIAGIISNLCNRYELYVLTFLRPMIVIGITLIVIEVIIFLGKKLKVGKIVNYMIGVNR
jgi:peptidoglycan/LPS O-acetylase OafA/YrhL